MYFSYKIWHRPIVVSLHILDILLFKNTNFHMNCKLFPFLNEKLKANVKPSAKLYEDFLFFLLAPTSLEDFLLSVPFFWFADLFTFVVLLPATRSNLTVSLVIFYVVNKVGTLHACRVSTVCNSDLRPDMGSVQCFLSHLQLNQGLYPSSVSAIDHEK